MTAGLKSLVPLGTDGLSAMLVDAQGYLMTLTVLCSMRFS